MSCQDVDVKYIGLTLIAGVNCLSFCIPLKAHLNRDLSNQQILPIHCQANILYSLSNLRCAPGSWLFPMSSRKGSML